MKSSFYNQILKKNLANNFLNFFIFLAIFLFFVIFIESRNLLNLFSNWIFNIFFVAFYLICFVFFIFIHRWRKNADSKKYSFLNSFFLSMFYNHLTKCYHLTCLIFIFVISNMIVWLKTKFIFHNFNILDFILNMFAFISN